MKPRKYATGAALKRHHGPLYWTNAYQFAHPKAFRRYLWYPGAHRRPKVISDKCLYRKGRDSGITFLISDRVPYRNVILFRHVIAERTQQLRISRMKKAM